MKANYHTHTYRCNHASGTDREYVEYAIQRGIEVLGFSDHSPYCFPDGYYSGFRMTHEQQKEYVESIEALKDEFSGKIKLYIGYEMEYYPEYVNKTVELIKSRKCDYLILGQHYRKTEIGQSSSSTPTESESDLSDYVESVISAIKSGLFFYIAHPDVMNYKGDIDIYREYMTRICQCAKEHDTPLEINLLGLREGRFYPVDEFWRIAANVGNKAIFGCDAHRPCDVAEEEGIMLGKKYADKFGIEVIEPMQPRFLK